MRLKKKRPNNHWLKSQGHYLSCFSTSKPSEPIRFACDMRLKTRYSLKATTKIPPPHSRKKEVPILRSQNTQNTRKSLKTDRNNPHSYFLLDSGTLIHFRWINLKLSLPQHNNHKTHSRKLNWVLTYQHTQELE